MATIKAGPAGWAIVQLVDSIEGTTVAELERDLRRYLPAVIFYAPAARAGIITKGHGLSTYLFVALSGTPHDVYKLERSYYVEAILRQPDSRTLQRLTDVELHALMKQQAGDRVAVQDRVRITAGDWSGVEATVVELLNGKVKVLIELASRRLVKSFPRNELQPV